MQIKIKFQNYFHLFLKHTFEASQNKLKNSFHYLKMSFMSRSKTLLGTLGSCWMIIKIIIKIYKFESGLKTSTKNSNLYEKKTEEFFIFHHQIQLKLN